MRTILNFKRIVMKYLLSALLIIILSLHHSLTFGQRNMQQIEVKITAGGKKNGALIQLPDDYNVSTRRYPIIIFLHGKSKSGNDLSKLALEGIPFWLDKGVKLEAVNPVDKQKYKFIVVMPQAPSFGLKPKEIMAVLDDLLQTYRIDTSRVYLTGYSAGGWAAVMAITESPAITKRIAAVVALSPTSLDDKNTKQFKLVANAGVHCWYFAGTKEPHFLEGVQSYIDSTNRYKPGLTKLTIHQNKHCCFKDFYDPRYKENGMNIYSWMLQYKRP
ncbi:hypothetical protein DF182_31285 [Chitinophaga flava]|uniref:Peptidase S9 prolyl oligopeptidase catalytic domain-containing protein n=2 Tax=Chitinophaga flava TaxID=2259036 RepID=A0A365XPT0_9BACT|nr:hypothetical protein DF182_31285 [Chitinophaga flava]